MHLGAFRGSCTTDCLNFFNSVCLIEDSKFEFNYLLEVYESCFLLTLKTVRRILVKVKGVVNRSQLCFVLPMFGWNSTQK